jgi:hypothetical protein
MKQIILDKKKKREQDRKKYYGKKWDVSDEHIIKVYDLYKANKISYSELLDHFPGRTFHAITDKVYFIRGKLGLVGKKDPGQFELPLGGELESGRKHQTD